MSEHARLLLVVAVVLTACVFCEPTYIEGCKNHPADMVFVLDESGSIWGQHFQDQLTFVIDIVDAFDVGKGQTHIGVVTFADEARVIFNLGEITSPTGLGKAIHDVTQSRGQTCTALALKLLRTEMMDATHARIDVPHIVIVITDGESDEPLLTAIEAAELHAMGVTVFAIGVGVMNDDELHAIASSPDYVFTVNNYGALDKLKHILTNEACKATTPPTTTTTTTEATTTTTTTLPQYTQRCRAVDVIFSIPEQAGISDTNSSLTFIQSLLPDLDIGPAAVRIGLTPRLCNDMDPIPLNSHDSLAGYKRGVRERHLTSTRISRQVEQLFVGLEHISRDAEKVAILMVDNVSEDPDLVLEIAEYAKLQGVRLVTIGIGDHVDMDELSQIASDDDIHHVTNYDNLYNIHDNLLDVICRPF